MNGPEADGEPVPGVDGPDQHGQIDRLGLRKLRANVCIDVIGSVGFGDQRHRFGPCQRGAFTIGIKRRFPPRIQQIQPLFSFAVLARVLGVHVDAERTAVDLRRPRLHQFDQ